MILTLLHFNDLHAQLDRLPLLAALVQRARQEAHAEGRPVLLLDGGDSSDRSVWESDITKGRANFALLEAMGVQASVVGNGEALQWGRGALEKLVASVHFPVLAANLVDCADPTRLAVPGLKSGHLLELSPGAESEVSDPSGSRAGFGRHREIPDSRRKGFKLGLVGLTAMYGRGYERYGYTAIDPLPVLKAEIAGLRELGAKTIILLSHLGYAPPEEKARWANPDTFTDDLAAEACPEIAVILGAHSHTTLETPLRVNQTLILQAGEYGRCLGQLELELDEESGCVLEHRYTLHSTEGVAPDPTISAMLELVREEAVRLMDTGVGEAAFDYPHYFDRPSPFGTLIADALRDICQADLTIFFSGFARAGLKAGPITRRHLYNAIPGSIHVSVAEVSGAQIRRMLEKMLASKYVTESFDPKRGDLPLGHPAISSNVRLDYNMARPPGERVTGCEIDGRPLNDSGPYRLASTYYTLNDITDDPEYDFIGLAPGQLIENVQVEKVLWEIVEDWLRDHSPPGPQ